MTNLQKEQQHVRVETACSARKKNKLVMFLSNLSVEPTMFFVIFTSQMYQLIAQNLYLEKACRVNMGYTLSVCDAMTDRNISGYTKSQEVTVQKLVAEMLGIRTAIQSFFPVCLIIFLGSWSDRHKRRKPLIIGPIIGEILCCLALILNIIFFYELPIIYTVLGDSLPLALLGGWSCLFIGAYSYVGERCSNSNRTLKMAAVSGARLIGNSLGYSVGGMLFVAIGFLGSFSLCIMTLLIALTFSFLLVNEQNTEMVNKGNQNFFFDFFSIVHLKEALKTCFKQGTNHRRIKTIMIILLIFCIAGPIHGEHNVNYIFTRFKFGWNVAQFGFFIAVKLSIELTGSVIAVIVLSKVFHCDETLIGILGLVGSIIANTIYALAPSSQYFYLGIIFDIFIMLPYIATQALVPKTVPSEELGQCNSVIGICDAAIPLIFGPLYTSIYKYTIDVFPGTYFLVTLFLKAISICLFAYLYQDSKKQRPSEKTVIKN